MLEYYYTIRVNLKSLKKYYVNGVGSNPAAFSPDTRTCAGRTRHMIHRTTNAFEVFMESNAKDRTAGLRNSKKRSGVLTVTQRL
uniref:Uncharacterized protein n=1 Tax=Caenorhabditis japonica TaxID=281687 RepID=A0A8R1EBR4_CAEJA